MISLPSDIIADNIEYFTSFFLFLENVLHKTNDNTLFTQLKDIKKSISQNENPTIKAETIYYLSLTLSECAFIESSAIIRHILNQVFNVSFQIPDRLITQSAFDELVYPQLFQENIEQDLSENYIKDLSSHSQKTLKPIGNYFQDFKTTYPFDKNTSLNIFEKFMKKSNKIRKYEQFLLWFPEYLELFDTIIEDMFNNEKLYMPKAEKYYLGIMAASAIECDILIKDLIKSFLINGGDPKWIIDGLSATPERIQKMGKINNILAHQPWKLKEPIKEMKMEGNLDYFVQSCIILTLFHRIASIIKCLKIKVVDTNISIKALQEKKLFVKNPETSDVDKIYSELQKETSRDKRQRELQIINLGKIKDIINPSIIINQESSQYSKFTSKECTIYQDFDTHLIQYLFNMEFAWEENGHYIIRDYWAGFSENFNEEFDFITKLTSHCFGSHKCIDDTYYFRFAIITYIEKIFGLCNETFDYSKTNKLIKKHIKSLIKNIACCPENVDLSVISRNDFNDQDLLHIILLSLIAKQRAQLTYITKELNDLKMQNE